MQRYEQSGQSQVDFCEAEGINMGVFQYWWRRYRDEQGQEEGPNQPSFLPIQVTDEGEFAVEINYPDGTQLRFAQAAPAAYLRQLLGPRWPASVVTSGIFCTSAPPTCAKASTA